MSSFLCCELHPYRPGYLGDYGITCYTDNRITDTVNHRTVCCTTQGRKYASQGSNKFTELINNTLCKEWASDYMSELI